MLSGSFDIKCWQISATMAGGISFVLIGLYMLRYFNQPFSTVQCEGNMVVLLWLKSVLTFMQKREFTLGLQTIY